MDNLTRFETKDGIELVIDTATGESFATQAGYARMSGLSKQAISKRYKKLVNSEGLKTAEIETGYGVKLVNLIPESIIADWIVDDNPKLAKAMMTAGVRLFIHQLAGFDTKSKPPAPEPAPTPKLPSVPEMMEGKRNSEQREMFLLEDSPAITSDRMKRMIQQKRMLQPSPKLQSFNNDNRPYMLIPSLSKSIPDGYTLQLFAGKQYWVRSDISDIAAKRQPIAPVSIVSSPGKLVEQTEKETRAMIITPESRAAAISRATANIAQPNDTEDAIASEFKPGTRQGKFIEVLATRIVDKLWEKIQQFLGAIGFKVTQTIDVDVVPMHNPAITQTQTLSTPTPSSLPLSTPEEQIPMGYIQLDDRWISPELYEELRHQ